MYSRRLKIILVDFSQVVIGAITVNLGKNAKRDNPEAKNLIRHMFFSSILGYKKRFRAYGEIVLAIDARDGYWRRDYFPHYKGHRKHSQDASEFDWPFIYECIDELKTELRENFTYKMIEVTKCEADDVIGVLCKWLQENELVQEGLFDGIPQEIMIVSSDGDFGQLQKYRNVKQWSPLKKALVRTPNAVEYIIEHICEGDTGDNIPNIMTADQWAKDRADNVKTRAVSLMKDRVRDFVANGEKACRNEQERANWIRNKKLVDFDEIPTAVTDSILSIYNTYQVKGNKTKMMTYMMSHRMKLLIESLSEF